MISLLQAGKPITLSDIGRRWGVCLVEPQLPFQRRLREEDAMATICTRHEAWATLFLSGVLSHLVRTLPARDPWRHLSARIATGNQTITRGDVPRPPTQTGALLPDGRIFGGPEHPHYPGSDREMDVDFAALSDGLTPAAAALFAFAADGWNSAHAALTLLRLNNLTHAVHSPNPTNAVRIASDAGEHLWDTADSAIRWAVHRRRLIHEAQPTSSRPYGHDVERGGADQLPLHACWSYATYTDSRTHSHLTPVDPSTIEAEIAADTLSEPVRWPMD